eukprot:3467508-Pleurochrysis_carterae.AAC.1
MVIQTVLRRPPHVAAVSELKTSLSSNWVASVISIRNAKMAKVTTSMSAAIISSKGRPSA